MFYEIIRKHPNKEAKFDVSVGKNLYKKGELVNEKVFIQVYGDKDSADRAIKDMIEAKFIKEKVEEKKDKKGAENEKDIS